MSVVEARLAGGNIEVGTSELKYTIPAVYVVNATFPGFAVALFAHEARALAQALHEAADDVTTSVVRELRRPHDVTETLSAVDG